MIVVAMLCVCVYDVYHVMRSPFAGGETAIRNWATLDQSYFGFWFSFFCRLSAPRFIDSYASMRERTWISIISIWIIFQNNSINQQQHRQWRERKLKWNTIKICIVYHSRTSIEHVLWSEWTWVHTINRSQNTCRQVENKLLLLDVEYVDRPLRIGICFFLQLDFQWIKLCVQYEQCTTCTSERVSSEPPGLHTPVLFSIV